MVQVVIHDTAETVGEITPAITTNFQISAVTAPIATLPKQTVVKKLLEEASFWVTNFATTAHLTTTHQMVVVTVTQYTIIAANN